MGCTDLVNGPSLTFATISSHILPERTLCLLALLTGQNAKQVLTLVTWLGLAWLHQCTLTHSSPCTAVACGSQVLSTVFPVTCHPGLGSRVKLCRIVFKLLHYWVDFSVHSPLDDFVLYHIQQSCWLLYQDQGPGWGLRWHCILDLLSSVLGF